MTETPIKHGGKRPGSGRKKMGEGRIYTSISLYADDLERIHQMKVGTEKLSETVRRVLREYHEQQTRKPAPSPLPGDAGAGEE